ncbi:MAG: hypothetical protein HY908_01595, partial [Myxococcales bacterium]|nr:hypothetical protein [Myxococcales bacterium]
MDAARSRRSRPGAALAVVAAALGACDGPTPEARTSATDPSSSASVAPEATLR